MSRRSLHGLRCKRESSSAESSIGSAWRCTILHSPFSRRKIVVLRSMYGVGSEPAIEAVVRSIASRYAKSSPTSAATTSHLHEMQSEKLEASFSNIGPTPATRSNL